MGNLDGFPMDFPTDPVEIARWISQKDDCAGFQDIASAIKKGNTEEAKKLAKRYKSWLSEYEKVAFTAFGLL